MAETTTAAVTVGYWEESRQPIYSAALILPFILIYEVGIVALRSSFINGGDAIVRTLFGRFFNLVGVRISFISVLVLLVCFLIWQIRKKGRWSLQGPVLAATFFESLLYAVVLFLLLAYVVQYLPGEIRAPAREIAGFSQVEPAGGPKLGTGLVAAAKGSGKGPALQDFVLYCGAGVYEELVFRVMLLGLLMLVFTKLFHMEHAYAAAWSVIFGALIFSGFHHVGGEPFQFGPFAQRAFAGVYFSAIYFNRSFGIAAASHALYDILVGLNYLR